MHPLRSLLACLSVSILVGGEVSPQGARLAARYDAMEVERLWLPGHPIDWRTGDPVSDRHWTTHCSAFVAAACERLGLYVLRPPEHRQARLATAQAEWMRQCGPEQGWRPVASPFEAQAFANQGLVVLALLASPDPKRSGHAALVRPSAKPEALLEAEGPQVIQAGAENAASTSLKQGFRHHRGARVSARECRVEFFVHELP